MSATTKPRHERIADLRQEIEGSLNASAHFDRTARIYKSVEELARLADDPVVAYPVAEPTHLERALTHARQACEELAELRTHVAKALGDDSEESLAIKRASDDLTEIVARWTDEKARWR